MSEFFFNQFQVNIIYPITFLVVCLFLVVLPIIDDPQLVGVALAIILGGIPVYFIFIYWKSKPEWLQNIIQSFDIVVQKTFLAMPSQD